MHYALVITVIIHRQAVAVKQVPNALQTVLDEVVKIVNFIIPLNSRIFSAVYDEMGSIYATLLQHMEVRWLSRGRILVRVFTLCSEMLLFSINHLFQFLARLCDTVWLHRLAYLAIIFTKIH
jgi:hypothetical protein